MNKTPNYQLSQWAKSDRVLMDDFNADNAKIDAALAGIAVTVPKFAAGSYTGNGASSRTISLPFTPKAVFVCAQEGQTYFPSGYDKLFYGGLAVTGGDLCTEQNSPVLRLRSGGFQVFFGEGRDANHNYYIYSNMEGVSYHYIAFG